MKLELVKTLSNNFYMTISAVEKHHLMNFTPNQGVTVSVGLMALPVDVIVLILKLLSLNQQLQVALVSKPLRKITINCRFFPQKAKSLRLFYRILRKSYSLRKPLSQEFPRCQFLWNNYQRQLQEINSTIRYRIPGKNSTMTLTSQSLSFQNKMLKCKVNKVVFAVDNPWFNLTPFNFVLVDFHGTNAPSQLYKISIPSKGNIVHLCLLDQTKIYVRDSYEEDFIIDFSMKI